MFLKNRFKSRKNIEYKNTLLIITLHVIACLSLCLIVKMGSHIILEALPAIKQFGAKFIIESTWDPSQNKYAAWPFISGSLLTATGALILSLPISISLSIVLGTLIKKNIFHTLINTLINISGSIPSVVYGLWGITTIFPLIQILQEKEGLPMYGASVLSAICILTLMIVPYSVSIGKEAIKQVPKQLKESAFALGGSHYEVIRHVILPHAKNGILAGSLLAFCKAIGESIAVTLLIGNLYLPPNSLLKPASSLSSLLTNEFSLTSDPLHHASLMYVTLILIVFSFVFTRLSKRLYQRP